MTGKRWRRSAFSRAARAGHYRAASPNPALARIFAPRGERVYTPPVYTPPETERWRYGFGSSNWSDCNSVKTVPDKNLRLDAKHEPIGIIGQPDSRAPEFLVRLELALSSNLVQLEVQLHRLIRACGNGDVLAASGVIVHKYAEVVG